MDRQDNSSGFLSGLVVGAVVGGALALLLTPRSGRETREALRTKGLELRERAEETIPATAEEVLSRALQTIETQRERLQRAAEEARRAAEEAREELLRRYERAKGAASDSAETGESPS